MSSKLPRLTGREMIDALARAGFGVSACAGAITGFSTKTAAGRPSQFTAKKLSAQDS